MSFIDDYSSIASALKAREDEKQPKSPIVTDPNPPEYVEMGLYAPSDPNRGGMTYPHGYLEAFEAYKKASISIP